MTSSFTNEGGTGRTVTKGGPLRRRTGIISLLAVVALVAGACSSDDADSSTTTTPTTAATTSTAAATTPTTTEAPMTTTTEAGPSAEETARLDAALAVKNSFFVAFNSAESETVMNLFTEDARFRNNFGPYERWEFEELLAWNTAQGTRYTPLDCSAAASTEPGEVIVSCGFITHDAPSVASGGPPVPFTMSMTVTAEGISSYSDQFGNPDFNVVGRPFNRWMRENHAEDAELVAFGTWNSLEEAAANGLAVAHYATEWGNYLEANNCGYNDNC